jgi:ribosomal protein L32E
MMRLFLFPFYHTAGAMHLLKPRSGDSMVEIAHNIGFKKRVAVTVW